MPTLQKYDIEHDRYTLEKYLKRHNLYNQYRDLEKSLAGLNEDDHSQKIKKIKKEMDSLVVKAYRLEGRI